MGQGRTPTCIRTIAAQHRQWGMPGGVGFDHRQAVTADSEALVLQVMLVAASLSQAHE